MHQRDLGQASPSPSRDADDFVRPMGVYDDGTSVESAGQAGARNDDGVPTEVLMASDNMPSDQASDDKVLDDQAKTERVLVSADLEDSADAPLEGARSQYVFAVEDDAWRDCAGDGSRDRSSDCTADATAAYAASKYVSSSGKTPSPAREKRGRRNVWAIAGSCALAAFTAFVLLDTFAIARVQQSVQEADMSSIVATANTQSTADGSDSGNNAGDATTGVSSGSSDAAADASSGSNDSSSSSSASSDSGESKGGKHKPGSSSSSRPSGGKHSHSSSGSSSDSGSKPSRGTPGSPKASRSSSSSSDGSSGSSSSSSSSESAAALVAGSGSAESAGTSIGSYSDENMQIEVSSLRAYDTDIYVADIQVSSAEYLKTALAQNAFGRNLKDTTSNMAEAAGAVLAINGDYYGFRDDGYVLRNGVLYRDTASAGTDALVVYGDGTMSSVNQSTTTAQELKDTGAWQVLSFGPVLVQDGQLAVDANDEVNRSMGSNPRTAIGMISPLHYVVVVSDGRTGDNAGLSLNQLAQVLVDNGATFAYNLDGGGSTTLYFKGEVLNNPTSGNVGGERSVSDIVYFG